jgi:lysophospholipase L1-like esterase
MRAILMILAATTLLACNKSKMETVTYTGTGGTAAPVPVGSTVTYLALGDSYTIGESVPANQNFPSQLVTEMGNQGYSLASPVIIARTGWTTDELINAIKERGITQKFDFVTLLIGVNNQYRGYSSTTYRAEFVQLVNTAIAYANGNNKRVFVLSIPDWGVTPYATGRDRSQIAAQIDAFNAINASESSKAGVNYLSITEISRLAATDQSLNAPDGLHPSGKMYGLWVKQLAPQVAAHLK